MARYLSDKYQRSGDKFTHSRIMNAVRNFQARERESAQSMHGTAFAFGMIAVVLVCVAGWFMNIMKPHGATRQQSELLATPEGEYFISYKGKLHPVTNVASAKIILGGRVKLQVVADNVIDQMPKGLLMGMLNAPSDLHQSSTSRVDLAVCDTKGVNARESLKKAKSFTTTTVVGKAPGVDVDADPKVHYAVLGSINNQLWVFWDNKRSLLSPIDYPAQAVFGLSSFDITHPVEVSSGLFNAVEQTPPFVIPTLASDGLVSGFDGDYRIGDLLSVVDRLSNERVFVVTEKGVTLLSPVVTQFFLNYHHKKFVVDESVIARFPLVRDVDLDQYPHDFPVFIHPQTLCFGYSKDASSAVSHTYLTYLDSDPFQGATVTHSVNPLVASRVMSSNRAFLVSVTDPAVDSLTRSLFYWVDDTGVLFSLSPDRDGSYQDLFRIFHWNEVSGLVVPWNVLSTLPFGGDVSVVAALTEHVNVPVDSGQRFVGKKREDSGEVGEAQGKL